MKKIHLILFTFLGLALQPAFSSAFTEKDEQDVTNAFYSVLQKHTSDLNGGFGKDELAMVSNAFVSEEKSEDLSEIDSSKIQIGDSTFGGISTDCTNGTEGWEVRKKNEVNLVLVKANIGSSIATLRPESVLELSDFPFVPMENKTVRSWRGKQEEHALNALQLGALHKLHLTDALETTIQAFNKLWAKHQELEEKREVVHRISLALQYLGEQIGFESSGSNSGQRWRGALKVLNKIKEDEKDLSQFKDSILVSDTSGVFSTDHSPKKKVDFFKELWDHIFENKVRGDIFTNVYGTDVKKMHFWNKFENKESEYEEIMELLNALFPEQRYAHLYFPLMISKNSSFYLESGEDTQFTFNFNGMFKVENAPFAQYVVQAKSD